MGVSQSTVSNILRARTDVRLGLILSMLEVVGGRMVLLPTGYTPMRLQALPGLRLASHLSTAGFAEGRAQVIEEELARGEKADLRGFGHRG